MSIKYRKWMMPFIKMYAWFLVCILHWNTSIFRIWLIKISRMRWTIVGIYYTIQLNYYKHKNDKLRKKLGE